MKFTLMKRIYLSVTLVLILAQAAFGASEESLVTDNSIRIPESWEYQKITGKPFYLDISFCPEMWEKMGLSEDEPFIKESALRIKPGLINAGSILYDKVLSMGNPVIIFGYPHSYPEVLKKQIDDDAFARFKEDFGSRYIATFAPGGTGEWTWWSSLSAWKDFVKKWNLSMPEDRKEAHETLLRFVKGRISKAAPGHKIWSIQSTFQSHCDYLLEEVALASPEIGGYMESTPMQFYFARGASRQYQKPWACYIAAYRPDGPNCYTYGILSPRCSWAWGNALWGPWSGTSVSLQRRQLYFSYMSGANIIRHESDGDAELNIFMADYDFRTINKVDPLVLLLQDKRIGQYQSPVLFAWKEFYDNIARKHDRGIPYTPVALLFDQYHGCMAGKTAIFGLFPFDDSDHMMNAVVSTLSGWGVGKTKPERRDEVCVMTTNPFGDIFDCVTNTASIQTLRGYPAIFTVGRVDIDDGFSKKLIQYVKEGGTLFINTKQLTPSLSLPSFLGVNLMENSLKGEGFTSLIDGISQKEEKEFLFDEVKPTSATTIVKSHNGYPLITLNKYGKGNLILTTPHYLYSKGSKDKMLKLFSYLMKNLNKELLPVSISGDIEYMLNKNKNGWVITLINNNGLYKSLRKKLVVEPEEKVDVKICFKKNIKVKRVEEWVKGESLRLKEDNGHITTEVTVPPGDIRIVEFFE